MLGPYGRLFRIRGYPLPFVMGLCVALTLGMVSLGLLLTVQQQTGSLAQAGFVSASFGLGNAVGLIVQGPLIDRHGQSRVLAPESVLCGGLLLAAAIPKWSGVVVIALLAVAAGLCFPATVSSMRVPSRSAWR